MDATSQKDNINFTKLVMHDYNLLNAILTEMTCENKMYVFDLLGSKG